MIVSGPDSLLGIADEFLYDEDPTIRGTAASLIGKKKANESKRVALSFPFLIILSPSFEGSLLFGQCSAERQSRMDKTQRDTFGAHVTMLCTHLIYQVTEKKKKKQQTKFRLSYPRFLSCSFMMMLRLRARWSCEQFAIV